MIYDILDTAFQAAMPAGFNYRTAPIWEINQKGFKAQKLPAMVFDSDFVAVDNYIPAGKQTTVYAHILFMQYHTFNDGHEETRDEIIDTMHTGMQSFYDNFILIGGVEPTIKLVEFQPIVRWIDTNLCGISSRVTFEFMNSVC